MKRNSGRKLMAMILFLVLPAVLLATVSVRSATADTVVSINEPSSLQTEKGIGIGSSSEDILQSYEQVNGTIIDPENQTRNIWIHGSDKVIINNGSTNLTIYYPTLTILLNQDKVTNIELSNEENEPE
jgi:hypothetical protein